MLFDNEIQIATVPIISSLSYNINSPLKVIFTFTAKPIIKLPAHFNDEEAKEIKPFSESIVDETLKKLLNNSSFFIPAPDDHVITYVDSVSFTYETSFNGKKLQQKKTELTEKTAAISLTRDSTTPLLYVKLAEATVGHVKGDIVQVYITMPSNHKNRNIAGKDVLYKVKVTKVNVREIPNLDENFFQKLNLEGVNSEETLREYIRYWEKHSLDEQSEARLKEELKIALVYLLHDINLPPAVLVQDAYQDLKEYFGSNEALEAHRGSISKDEFDRLFEGYYQIAKINLLMEYTLDTIVKENNIEATQEDYDNYLKRLAGMNYLPLKYFQQKYDNEDSKKMIGSFIEKEKAYKALKEKFTIKELAPAEFKEFIANKHIEYRKKAGEIKKERLASTFTHDHVHEHDHHEHEHPHEHHDHEHEHSQAHEHDHEHDHHDHEHESSNSHEHDHEHDHHDHTGEELHKHGENDQGNSETQEGDGSNLDSEK
jgi:FKBP-type peptidyl-prolyl cis-trans isomerase (trigger factor)